MKGCLTYIYKTNMEINSKGYVYSMLRRQFNDESIGNRIQNMTLLKDKMVRTVVGWWISNILAWIVDMERCFLMV